MKSLRILAAAIVCTLAGQTAASAAQIVLSQTVSDTDTASVSNLTAFTFLSDPFSFAQFDPATGTLTSAQLSWDFTTSATVTPRDPIPNVIDNPFMSGTVSYTFNGTSVSSSFNNVTTVQNLTFTGPDGSVSLALAPVIGTGTFSAGTLEGILDLASPSLFPVGLSSSYTGTLSLTYQFEPIDGRAVPEPTSMVLLGSGLITAAARARRARRQRSSI
jgi:hypothetical protein